MLHATFFEIYQNIIQPCLKKDQDNIAQLRDQVTKITDRYDEIQHDYNLLSQRITFVRRFKYVSILTNVLRFLNEMMWTNMQWWIGI